MHVERATVEEYRTYLQEPSRPPSKGGNTRAWHGHVLTIRGDKYSFRALGSKKWVYSSDTVSFDWDWDQSERYRNIDPTSVRVWDRHGKPVERGERATKKWRTAQAKLPGSRRERRD